MSTKMSKKELLAKLQTKIAAVNVGGGNFWKPDDGLSRIRIVPGVGDMGFFFQEVGQHYSLPGDKIAFCPHFTSEGEFSCPICELCLELQGGGQEDQNLASGMWLRKKYWMNVIVRKADDTSASTGDGPFIWNGVGSMIFQQIKSLVLNPEYGDISDIQDGIDLVIHKEGTGINTKYDVATARRDTPLMLNEEKIAEILEKAVDLDPVMLTGDIEKDAEISKGKFVKLLSYDAMITTFLSSDPEPAVQDSSADLSDVKTLEDLEDKKRESVAATPDPAEVHTATSDVAAAIQARIAARRRRT